jgi:hypothetical protein
MEQVPRAGQGLVHLRLRAHPSLRHNHCVRLCFLPSHYLVHETQVQHRDEPVSGCASVRGVGVLDVWRRVVQRQVQDARTSLVFLMLGLAYWPAYHGLRKESLGTIRRSLHHHLWHKLCYPERHGISSEQYPRTVATGVLLRFVDRHRRNRRNRWSPYIQNARCAVVHTWLCGVHRMQRASDLVGR